MANSTGKNIKIYIFKNYWYLLGTLHHCACGFGIVDGNMKIILQSLCTIFKKILLNSLILFLRSQKYWHPSWVCRVFLFVFLKQCVLDLALSFFFKRKTEREDSLEESHIWLLFAPSDWADNQRKITQTILSGMLVSVFLSSHSSNQCSKACVNPSDLPLFHSFYSSASG